MSLVLLAEQGMFTTDRQRDVWRAKNVVRADIPQASHDAHLDAFETWIARVPGFLVA